MTDFDRRPDALLVTVDGVLYPETVLFKCFYWYGSEHSVDINTYGDSQSYRVTLRPLKGTAYSEAQLDALELRIRQDLIDFKTRDIVARETKAIRELIVAKAFARSDELDAAPPGNVSDPVGFEPKDFEGAAGKEI